MNNSNEKFDGGNVERENSASAPEIFLNPNDGSEIDTSPEHIAAEEKYLEDVYKQKHNGESRDVLSFEEVNTSADKESSNENYEISSVDFEVASGETLDLYEDIYSPRDTLSKVKDRVKEIKMQDGSTAPTDEEIVEIVEEVESGVEKEKNWTDKAKTMVNVAMLTTMMALSMGKTVEAVAGNYNSPTTIEQGQESARERAQISAAMGQGMMDAQSGKYAGSSYLSRDMKDAYDNGFYGKSSSQSTEKKITYRKAIPQPARQLQKQKVTHTIQSNKTYTPQKSQYQAPQRSSYIQESPTYKEEQHARLTMEEINESRKLKEIYKQGVNDADSGRSSLAHQYSRQGSEAYSMGYERGANSGNDREDDYLAKTRKRQGGKYVLGQDKEGYESAKKSRKGWDKTMWRLLGGEGSVTDAVREGILGMTEKDNR